jgi:hypothetical protein
MFTTTIILLIGIAAQTLVSRLFGQKAPGSANSFKVVSNSNKHGSKSSRRITRRIARRAQKSSSLVQAVAR